MIDQKTKKEAASRMTRIEGQIRGIAKMIQEGKYCIDVINQIHAARRALDRMGFMLIENHINTCIKNGLTKKNDSKNLIGELTKTLDQFLK